MTLSTEVKTHAIVTFTKSHYLITEKQHNALKMLSADQSIVVDGNTIKGSNIAEVMTVEKYYEINPERRPEPKKDMSFLNAPDNRDGRGWIEKMAEWYKKNPKQLKTKGGQFFIKHMRWRRARGKDTYGVI